MNRPEPVLRGPNVNVYWVLHSLMSAAPDMETTDEETSSGTGCGECGHALDIRTMESTDESMTLYLLCCPRCRMLEVQGRWTGVPDWWVKHHAEPKE